MIASGGVGTLDHLVEGVVKAGADAVLAASIFHFGEFTIGEAKRYCTTAVSRCGCSAGCGVHSQAMDFPEDEPGIRPRHSTACVACG